MTVINTNVGALTARTYAIKANESMQKSMERLSSGLRINSAADDAAGLAVANKMESQLRGMNVAIRNSQDAISLVQTAEAGMGEITNMIIRMRELSVQMNNGVYTDSDRSNAQLEVTALLAEINKIASNTAFNDVKVLDGSYQADIRAGNTNAETIKLGINRMNTDSLGGDTIPADRVSIASDTVITTNNGVVNGLVRAAEKTEAKTSISVVADTVTANSAGTVVKINQFGSEMDSFVSTYSANSSYQLLAADGSAVLAASPFYNSINATTGQITANVNYNATDATKNVHEFQVVYTGRDSNNVEKSFTDNITIEIKENTTDAVVKSATSTVSSEEGAITLYAANSQAVTGSTPNNAGVFSAELSAFIKADGFAGSFELTGTDAADFTISSAADTTGPAVYNFGKITANLDFENPTGGTAGNTNSYSFNVEYTSSTGDKFVETIALSVTDKAGDAEIYTIAAPTVPSTTVTGDKFKIDVGSTTITAAATAAAGTYDLTQLVADLNTQINTLNAATPGTVNGTFSKVSNDLVFTFAEGQGNTADVVGTLKFAPKQKATSVATEGDATTTPATDEVVNFAYASADLPGSVTAGDTFTLSVNGTDITYTVASNDAAFNLTKLAAGFEANKGTLAGAFAADTTNGVKFTYTSQADETNTGDAGIVATLAVKASTKTQDGQGNTAAAATVTVSANTTTTSVLGGSKSTRAQDEVVASSSAIQLEEAPTIQFGVDALSASLRTFAAAEAHTGGSYSLSGADASKFEVSSEGTVTSRSYMDFEADQNSFALNVVYTDRDGNTFTEAVTVALSNSTDDAGDHIADVNVSTQAGAANAIDILDLALNQISASQAELGAIQNRLTHNIDNLSMGSMLTETSRGRIVDADFARETSELSKQQILGQAATSMLAQANQSKQSVLALLQ